MSSIEEWLYSDVVKEHFMNPKNVLMDDESTWPCDGRGIVGNIKCGDQMLILLRIEGTTIKVNKQEPKNICKASRNPTEYLTHLMAKRKCQPIEVLHYIKPKNKIQNYSLLNLIILHLKMLPYFPLQNL